MLNNDPLIGFTCYVALVVGAPFVMAGIAGFIPFFTPHASDGINGVPPLFLSATILAFSWDCSWGSHFNGRMYAAAFGTPAVAAWILSFRRRFAVEYLSLGLNLVAGGFLPVLGTLWTNLSVPLERQVNFSAAGTWAFLSFFSLTGIFGCVLLNTAIALSKKGPTPQT